MSYHNGSIWPHDNSLIALGCALYGLKTHADRIFDANFAAASYMDMRRLPEALLRLPPQARAAAPTLYPRGLLAASLGERRTVPHDPGSQLRPRGRLDPCRRTRSASGKPSLPPFLRDQIILRASSASTAPRSMSSFAERTGHASVRVLRSTGKVHVAIIFD